MLVMTLGQVPEMFADPMAWMDHHKWPFAVAFLVGVVLLLLGGNWLVDGAVHLARRCGVSTLLIGLTVVAGGTSSPELVFNLVAASGGHSDLSFGNVVGSNIANIAFVLGIASLVRPLPVHSRVVRKELPWLLVVTIGFIALAVAPPGGGDPLTHGFSRLDGIAMLFVFALFLAMWYRLARSDRSDPMADEVIERAEQGGTRPVAVGIVLLVVGLVALVTGAKAAEVGAVGIAEWANVPPTIIGLTIVAIATSLPELVASVVAVLRGHGDLAVGNVIGSNLFNILFVMGATSTVATVGVEPEYAGISTFARSGWFDLGVMLVLTILLLPMGLTNDRRIVRFEGAFLAVCYAAYLTWCALRA